MDLDFNYNSHKTCIAEVLEKFSKDHTLRIDTNDGRLNLLYSNIKNIKMSDEGFTITYYVHKVEILHPLDKKLENNKKMITYFPYDKINAITLDKRI